MKKKTYMAPDTMVVNIATITLLEGSPKITNVVGPDDLGMGEGEIPTTADSRRAGTGVWDDWDL